MDCALFVVAVVAFYLADDGRQNLQAVLDEYAHYLVDAEGLSGRPPAERAEGVARATISNLVHRDRRPQGASTITQQVAKNFFLAPDQSMVRKIKEAVLALRIEQSISKNKILELYLNEIYLGMGNYGVAAAALNYFGKSVDELSIAQAVTSLPEIAEHSVDPDQEPTSR